MDIKKSIKNSLCKTLNATSVECQESEVSSPETLEKSLFVKKVDRRRFITNAVKIGVGLPFMAQIVLLEGCGSSGNGGSSADSNGTPIGSATITSGNLAGDQITLMSASTDAKLVAEITTPSGQTSTMTLQVPSNISNAFGPPQTPGATYTLNLLDPNGKAVSSQVTVIEFADKTQITVSYNGQDYTAYLNKNTSASNMPWSFVKLAFADVDDNNDNLDTLNVAILLYILALLGEATLDCIQHGGSPTFVITPSFSISFACKMPSGSSGSGA